MIWVMPCSICSSVMRFTNRFDSSKSTNIWDILKWKLTKLPSRVREVSNLTLQNDVLLLDTEDDFICWLGHATFLIQLEQKRFLFDPVLKNIPFYKRHTSFPYRLQELGKIDYVLISHTHYDHFDAPSIKALSVHKPQFIVPLGMETYLYKIDKNASVRTLDWYQTHTVNRSLNIHFVPAKHWGRRGIFDTNKALWGGFVVSSTLWNIYFAGDTAYDTHFKEIGQTYNIDHALLPIGAYNPRFFMKHHHLNPLEAYMACQDLQAKTLLPMHYGTFNLTDEPINEPKTWIEKIKKQHPQEIYMINIGEVLRLKSDLLAQK